MPDDQPKKSKRSSQASENIPPPDVVVSQGDPVVVPPEAVDVALAPQPKPIKLMAPGTWAGLFGKGFRRDIHDISKDLTIRHLLGALRDTNPLEEMGMEQYITGVMGVKNQGQTGRCLAFAFARAAQLRSDVAGVPLLEWPSTTGLYTVARAYERARQGFTADNTPLTDGGSIPQDMVNGANDYGVANDSAWPSESEASADINAEPNIEELKAASKGKFPGYYRISSTGAQRVEDVKQALAAGYPVVIGVQVDPAFEQYAGGIAEPDTMPPIPKAVTAPDLTQDLGGHGLCLHGYKTFPGGVTLFRGCNSWDVSWGDYGLFWADVTWLCDASVMDILVITYDPHSHAVAA